MHEISKHIFWEKIRKKYFKLMILRVGSICFRRVHSLYNEIEFTLKVILTLSNDKYTALLSEFRKLVFELRPDI